RSRRSGRAERPNKASGTTDCQTVRVRLLRGGSLPPRARLRAPALRSDDARSYRTHPSPNLPNTGARLTPDPPATRQPPPTAKAPGASGNFPTAVPDLPALVSTTADAATLQKSPAPTPRETQSAHRETHTTSAPQAPWPAVQWMPNRAATGLGPR